MAVTTVTAIAMAVSAAGAAASAVSARKAAKAKKSANNAQRKINELRNKQARREFLRNFRQAQANVLVESVMAGVGLDSSRFQGTLSSHESQKGTALAEFKEFNRLGKRVTALGNKAMTAEAQGTMYQGVSNIASSFIGM